MRSACRCQRLQDGKFAPRDTLETREGAS